MISKEVKSIVSDDFPTVRVSLEKIQAIVAGANSYIEDSHSKLYENRANIFNMLDIIDDLSKKVNDQLSEIEDKLSKIGCKSGFVENLISN